MTDIVLDSFALRQFDTKNRGSTTFIDYNPEAFEKKVNEVFHNGYSLIDGYAPFCKHLFIPNFIGDNCFCSYVHITNENRHLLQSGYKSRTEHELPVLTRWFSRNKITPSIATHLDIILYSRQQIELEHLAMTQTHATIESKSIKHNYSWGIVSIKPQDCDHELPMLPITAMRNSLGREFGGSGEKLNIVSYLKSCEFWNENAVVIME